MVVPACYLFLVLMVLVCGVFAPDVQDKKGDAKEKSENNTNDILKVGDVTIERVSRRMVDKMCYEDLKLTSPDMIRTFTLVPCIVANEKMELIVKGVMFAYGNPKNTNFALCTTQHAELIVFKNHGLTCILQDYFDARFQSESEVSCTNLKNYAIMWIQDIKQSNSSK